MTQINEYILPKNNPLPFIHPSTIMVNGPTGCGKTFFVKNMIKNKIVQPEPEKIVWFFGESQSLHSELSGTVQFVEGLPSDFAEYIERGKRHLFIIDDLMKEAAQNSQFSDLFTKMSHHRGVTVCWITQNLYHQGKHTRDISINTQYLVLFENYRDNQQIAHLSRQLYPDRPTFLMSAYKDATKQKYGYLILDLKANTEEIFRVRSLNKEGHYIIYKKR